MSNRETDSDLLGEVDAAEYIGGIPHRTLRQWRYYGKGPRFVKIGKHVRYRVSDLNAWLDANTVQPGGH
jgi:hypothetical protein